MFKRFGRTVRRTQGQMNGTERRYAEFLDMRIRAGQIVSYLFDSVKLKLADNTFYTPDFFVIHADDCVEIHEVKGTSKGKPFVEDDAAVKIKVAAEKFPFRFKMVWFYQGQWCERNYFDP